MFAFKIGMHFHNQKGNQGATVFFAADYSKFDQYTFE